MGNNMLSFLKDLQFMLLENHEGLPKGTIVKVIEYRQKRWEDAQLSVEILQLPQLDEKHSQKVKVKVGDRVNEVSPKVLSCPLEAPFDKSSSMRRLLSSTDTIAPSDAYSYLSIDTTKNTITISKYMAHHRGITPKTKVAFTQSDKDNLYFVIVNTGEKTGYESVALVKNELVINNRTAIVALKDHFMGELESSESFRVRVSTRTSKLSESLPVQGGYYKIIPDYAYLVGRFKTIRNLNDRNKQHFMKIISKY